MKHLKHYFIILILALILPQNASANIFTILPTDKSVEFLGTIFGSNLGAIYLGGSPNPVLSKLFEMLNTVVVSLGTIIVSYIGIVSTINTAQEGKTMGRKWNSIWIPMRSVLGMALMIPSPSSGYSVIQAMVMWILMQGIGAADQIWNMTLRHLSYGVSATRAVFVDDPNSQGPSLETLMLEQHANELAKEALQAATCMASMHHLAKGTYTIDANQNRDHIPRGLFSYYHGETIRPHIMLNPSNSKLKQNGYLLIGLPDDPEYHSVCGKFYISATVQPHEHNAIPGQDTAKLIFDKKAQALEIMINNYLPLVNLLMYPSQVPIPGGFKQQAMNAYIKSMQSIVKPVSTEAWIKDAIHKGSKNGWISAGSFYFVLNQGERSQLFSDVMQTRPKLVANSITVNQRLEYRQEHNFFSRNLRLANNYWQNDNTVISNKLNLLSPTNDNQPANGPSSLFRNLQIMATETLAELMSSATSGDPILSHAKFGSKILLTTEVVWIELIKTLKELLIDGNQQVGANNYEQSMFLLLFAGTISIGIAGIIWGAAAILAIYVPLIPYMMFTVGALGWFLLVAEAIVAAPVFMLGFILPSGEELGKVQHGLMLLINITLRPSLMLFGFLLATRIYQAVINLVNFGLIDTFKSVELSGSILAWVPTMILYAAFVTALANKCFALIYALPDKILRWIGGQPEHTDANQELQHTKGGMAKASDAANKVSSGVAIGEFAIAKERFKQQRPSSPPPGDEIRS